MDEVERKLVSVKRVINIFVIISGDHDSRLSQQREMWGRYIIVGYI